MSKIGGGDQSRIPRTGDPADADAKGYRANMNCPVERTIDSRGCATSCGSEETCAEDRAWLKGKGWRGVVLKIIVAFTQLGATRRRQLWIRDKIVHCAWVASHACSLLTRTLGRAARVPPLQYLGNE